MGSSVPRARFILRKIWNKLRLDGTRDSNANFTFYLYPFTMSPWTMGPWNNFPWRSWMLLCKKKEYGGVGKRTWKPLSKLSPYKTDKLNIFLNSQRFPCLIFLWSCCRLVQGRYTTVCLAGETFCSLYTILSDLL